MSVMVGTPVKNCEETLPLYLDILENLTYPRDLIRVVFIYGDSTDRTFEILDKFRRRRLFKVEIYAERRDADLRNVGMHGGASIYRDFKKLFNEDYFMLFDADVIKAPEDLIEALMDVNADITAPYVYDEQGNFYDTYVFRLNGMPFHWVDPPAKESKKPIYVDSVGTVFLASKLAFMHVPIRNPVPNLFFCFAARSMGFNVVACPYIRVYHISPKKPHHPPPIEYGWPSLKWEVWATSSSHVVYYEKPDPIYEHCS